MLQLEEARNLLSVCVLLYCFCYTNTGSTGVRILIKYISIGNIRLYYTSRTVMTHLQLEEY